MRATNRYWTTVAVGGVLVSLALLAARPVALVGAAGIGAWLLTTQFVAAERMAAVPDGVSASVSVESERATVDRELFVTFAVERDVPSGDRVEAVAPLPAAARGPDRGSRTVRLGPGDHRASTTFELTFPVAGQFSFPRPRVSVSDWSGQFEESIRCGDAPEVTVEPLGPHDLHVGRGGERATALYGEHATDQAGSGLIPAEIRRYAPGDSISRIDWNATARFDHPHVREFETETDRRTALVFDHRASMALGPEGASMLDYAREVALWYSHATEQLDDPLGLYTVGDGGTTTERHPSGTSSQYQRVRDRLYELTPTSAADDGSSGRVGRRTGRGRTLRGRLRGDDSAFAARLRPFFESTDGYVRRVTSDPLYAAVRRQRAQLRGTVWTALVTDDSRRAETLETVRLAVADGNYALVFLTPRVLYEGAGLAELEPAYHRYVEFEEFRRELERLPRVTAFEVAPNDRLSALLDAGRGERAEGAPP